MTEEKKSSFERFYNKHYKTVLIIPALLLILSLVYLAIFYQQHGDIFQKDISLTGGTSITIYEDIDHVKLENDLSSKLQGLEVTQLYDLLTQKQKGIIISTTTDSDTAKKVLEEYLGKTLDEKNSSIEFTGPTLSASFYSQLQKALIAAFLLMSLVVFLLFGTERWVKIYAIILSLFCLNFLFTNLSLITPVIAYFLLPLFIISTLFIKIPKRYKWGPIIFFVLIYILHIFINLSILLIPFIIILAVIYIFVSVPSLAVIISAFGDILMTIAVVDLLGIKISTAGIVAFLMLIGFSVDTDIMLTNRLLRSVDHAELNTHLYSAFKTGLSMTLASLFTILAALLIVSTLSPVLYQIFLILFIGLLFDIFNTWVTNASLLKWYLESKERRKKQ